MPTQLDEVLIRLSDELAEHLRDTGVISDSVTSERVDARRISLESLRGIVSLGFDIRRTERRELSEDAFPTAEGGTESTGIHRLWQVHNRADWSEHPQRYLDLAKRAAASDPLFAYDVLSEALTLFPEQARLDELESGARAFVQRVLQLLALTLIQIGAKQRARDILEQLQAQTQADGETLGLLGRIQKDHAFELADPAARATALRTAMQTYLAGRHAAIESGRSGDATYCGINAATLALLSGDPKQAGVLVADVSKACRTELKQPDVDSFWPHATLGEAALIGGDIEAAARCYGRAVAAQGAEGRDRDLGACRRQARLLLDHLGAGKAVLDELLFVPPCAVFSADRAPSGRMRDADLQHLDDKIQACLQRLQVKIGYACPATPGEILFLEHLHQRGGEINIALPQPAQTYRQAWIQPRLGGDWAERFDRLIENAVRLVELCDEDVPSLAADQQFADRYLEGLASFRARTLAVDVVRAAPGFAAADASSLPALWQHQGYPVELLESPTPPSPPDAVSGAVPEGDPSRTIRAMLFADAEGFSRLSDRQLLRFSAAFFDHTAAVVDKYDDAVLYRRTEGDGLYFVLVDVAAACAFGLDLRDALNGIDWEAIGLPAEMGVRFSMDCGPVHAHYDPVTRQQSFSGLYINRAARLEPLTPRDNIYVSESFAAVATAQNVAGCTLEYVGQLVLPKAWGPDTGLSLGS